jgi:predicted ester cyclase
VDGDIEGRVRAFWEQAFNARDLDVIDAITAPEFVNRNALPGTLLGVPATGRKVEWRQCHLYRFDKSGRAVEHDAIRDDVGLPGQFDG